MAVRLGAAAPFGRGLFGYVAQRTPWQRRFLALGAGALAALALPPVHAVPLLVPAFVLLVALVADAPSWRRAFGAGFWMGFGYFVGGLYWLAWPLTLDIARFGWLIPPAVFGISFALALFVGAATAAAHAARFSGMARIAVLAAAWAAAEWLRGHVPTLGFPWNPIGSAWAFDARALQLAAYVGVFGLGFFTVLIAALPALWFEPGAERRWRGPALAGALLAAATGLGVWRVDRHESAATNVPGVSLRLVQGNVAQTLKWDPTRRETTFTRYIDLTRSAGFDGATHVIWPETAIDYRIETDFAAVRLDDERRRRLAEAVPANGALILGAIRDRDERWYNSVHVIGPDGRAVATYDKHHLVPFGEYVPARPLLRRLGIERIAHGQGDYSAGPGLATLDVPGAPPIGPLICYEAIFPAKAARADRRPGWLVNVTNDAWFGVTSGPYQHLAAARLRAVEEGLPLARAANTGISAVIDPIGRVVARLGLGETGVLDAKLPAALAPTLFARLGDGALALLLASVLALVWSFSRRNRRDQ
jgi:apolipoprotein N-acyltransferase